VTSFALLAIRANRPYLCKFKIALLKSAAFLRKPAAPIRYPRPRARIDLGESRGVTGKPQLKRSAEPAAALTFGIFGRLEVVSADA
jgi:hypothetical protein